MGTLSSASLSVQGQLDTNPSFCVLPPLWTRVHASAHRTLKLSKFSSFHSLYLSSTVYEDLTAHRMHTIKLSGSPCVSRGGYQVWNLVVVGRVFHVDSNNAFTISPYSASQMHPHLRLNLGLEASLIWLNGFEVKLGFCILQEKEDRIRRPRQLLIGLHED